IIAQTKVIDSSLNPVWNEVHYLPVKHIGEKFILEAMDFNTFIKDKTIGKCYLEITPELVREVSDDVYEGTPNGIDEKPFDLSTFYVLITLQGPNGGFPPSVALANLF
ncbi:5426_t:CDS:2, partial [Racocetra fulgida]